MSETAITVAQVTSDFKIFQEFSDDHVTEAITRATKQVAYDQLTDQVDEATILFARHLLFSDWEASYGGVLSASTFGNSQSMKDYGGNDPFMRDYTDLVTQYGQSNDLGEVWTL